MSAPSDNKSPEGIARGAQPSSLLSPSPSTSPSASPSPNAPAAALPLVAAKHSPLFRNFVHVGAFLIFFIPFGMLLDPRNKVAHAQAVVVGFMIFVTVFNILVLPRLESGKRIARPGEEFVNGQWLYPLSLALCFLALPPFAAMGAWAAMAGGDAAASFCGRIFPRPKLPWNAKKSWAGLIGFMCVAFPFCWLAMFVCPSQQFLRADNWPELPFLWTLSVLAAVSGALIESLESRYDDNLRVPLGVGLVLALSGMFLSWATRELPAETHVQPERFIEALIANAILGGAILALKFADFKGTLLGVTFGVIIYFFAGWQGYLLFLLFVAIGSALSKVGLKHKQAIGAAEAREGKRGVSNVAANLLVAALCCLLYRVWGGYAPIMMAFAGSLAAAFADTASSEIGALSKGQPLLITTRQPVPHGTNGAVTWLGMLAALLAAGILATAAALSGFFEQSVAHAGLSPAKVAMLSATIVAAGFIGTTVDSFLGATVEDRVKGVHKGAVNFACTLAGAIAAGLISAAVV